jgi:hypothetical protein
VKQALQQRVHVAGGALVLEPDHARGLFAAVQGVNSAQICEKAVRKIRGKRGCQQMATGGKGGGSRFI